MISGQRKKTLHLCPNKGYDYDDGHHFAEQAHYITHIKPRRRHGVDDDPAPSETRYPARRWVVERTWLSKRRSIRTRWGKKSENRIAHISCLILHFTDRFSKSRN